MSIPSRRRSLGGNFALNLAGNLGAPLAGIVSAPILARALTVDERGIVSAASAPLVLGVSVFTLGIPEAMTFFRSSNRLEGRDALRGILILLALGLVGSGAIFAASGWLSGGRASLAGLIAAVGFVLTPALCVAGLRGVAMGLGEWHLITTERIIGAFARLTLLVLLVLTQHLNVWTASVVIASSYVLGGVVYLRVLVGEIAMRRKPEHLSRHGPPPHLLNYGIRLAAGALSGILLARLDQALMTPLSSAYQLGIYAVAVNVAEVALIANSALRELMFAEESGEQNDRRLTQITRLSTAFTCICGLVLAVASVPLLPLLFGQNYAPAVPVVWILVLGIALGNPGSIVGAGLSGRGRPGLRSISLAIACSVNVVVIVALVPVWGAAAAAAATLMGNMKPGGLKLFMLRRVSGVAVRESLGIRRRDIAVFIGLFSKLGGRRGGNMQPQPRSHD